MFLYTGILNQTESEAVKSLSLTLTTKEAVLKLVTSNFDVIIDLFNRFQEGANASIKELDKMIREAKTLLESTLISCYATSRWLEVDSKSMDRQDMISLVERTKLSLSLQFVQLYTFITNARDLLRLKIQAKSLSASKL